MWSTYTQPEIRAAEEILHKPIFLPHIDEVAMNYLSNYTGLPATSQLPPDKEEALDCFCR